MSLFGKPVHVPVVEVNAKNIKEVWPSLCLAIKSATYIGVDTELSGLGDRKLLNSKSVEDRYKAVGNAAKSRSVLSLGISCFKLKPDSDDKKRKWQYCVQTYNIMVLCEEEYVVEPASLKFLVNHGFNFNLQYASGVPYYRGNDREKSSVTAPSVRGIISLLVYSHVPLVFHNALVDLIFLYQNFYADLPSKLTSFVTDLSEMFSGGILDTKYITDFIERFEASYLEYVFMQCQRENSVQLSGKGREVYLEFPTYPDGYQSIGYHRCGYTVRSWESAELERIRSSICLCFAAHGWCSKPTTCKGSHDVDLIISTDFLLSAKQRRNKDRNRKRKMVENKSTPIEKSKCTGKKMSYAEMVSKKDDKNGNTNRVDEANELVLKKAKLIEEISKSYNIEITTEDSMENKETDKLKEDNTLLAKVSDVPSKSPYDKIATIINPPNNKNVNSSIEDKTEDSAMENNIISDNSDNKSKKLPGKNGDKITKDDMVEADVAENRRIKEDFVNPATVSEKQASGEAQSISSGNHSDIEQKDRSKEDSSETFMIIGSDELGSGNISGSTAKNEQKTDEFNSANILENEVSKQDKNSKSNTVPIQLSSVSAELSAARSGGHRAGFDAFMTGAILSVFIAKHSKQIQTKENGTLNINDFNVQEFINNIYLSGKDIPLTLTKSQFSKTSYNHKQKMHKLKHSGL